MNIQARYNLQKGVQQDVRRESTTYNVEDAIDRYIIARVQLRNNVTENRAIIKEQDLEQAAYTAAAAALDKLLKDL